MIECRKLEKTYQMGNVEVKALEEVDLEIAEGKHVSIMGPSGSGKSTLMHLLGLIDSPTSGQIHVNGRRVDNLQDKEKARMRLKEIGFVFQFYSLLKGFKSIRQAVLPQLLRGIPEKAAEIKAEKALKKVGLENRMDHRPKQLSGGQRQRVAIARALTGDPSIILADESTSQLDTETSEEIMDLYGKLSRSGQTVVTVNHEEKLAERAERTIWLEDGEIKNRED
jgi:ABC-type lipoprotein export system ATPase subunit